MFLEGNSLWKYFSSCDPLELGLQKSKMCIKIRRNGGKSFKLRAFTLHVVNSANTFIINTYILSFRFVIKWKRKNNDKIGTIKNQTKKVVFLIISTYISNN